MCIYIYIYIYKYYERKKGRNYIPLLFHAKIDLQTSIYIYIYIYIYNLHNGECASVFNALFKTRRVSAFAFLRGLNMQLLQSRNSTFKQKYLL